MAQQDTIVALSSGSLPSGVAIIRISGSKVRDITMSLVGELTEPRILTHKNLKYQDLLIDSGLVVYFPAPNSFTGEDCLELHVHGSRAVVQKLLNILISFDGVRLAQAGEFTKIAFENGKIDLVEAEGLADLLAAETENQRIQAITRANGAISEKINLWRKQLLEFRGQIEALIDFSDEEDIEDEIDVLFISKLKHLANEFRLAINQIEYGRIVREGFRVAIAGPVNAGKSSLINRLAKSDLAIVSEEAGTTRDIREVEMDIDGQLVIFIDMAGLRESSSIAENEGIRRARQEIEQADLLLWLIPYDATNNIPIPELNIPILKINTKSDLGQLDNLHDIEISNITGDGIDELLQLIKKNITTSNFSSNNIISLSRLRDKEALEKALEELELAINNFKDVEIIANALFRASNSLERLLGKIDPELILGEIFSNFCIGK